jgi:hypothetical protein
MVGIYADSWREYLPRLKQVKQGMDTTLQIIPVEAVPGTPARIIAFGKRPGWLCEYALVNDSNNDDAVAAAMAWAMWFNNDSRATTMEKQLSRWFGAEVKEVTNEVRA